MVGGTGNYSRQGGRKRLLTPIQCKLIHRRTGHIKNHPPFSAIVQPLSANPLPPPYTPCLETPFSASGLPTHFCISFFIKNNFLHIKIFLITTLSPHHFPSPSEKLSTFFYPLIYRISKFMLRTAGHCGALHPG